MAFIISALKPVMYLEVPLRIPLVNLRSWSERLRILKLPVSGWNKRTLLTDANLATLQKFARRLARCVECGNFACRNLCCSDRVMFLISVRFYYF